MTLTLIDPGPLGTPVAGLIQSGAIGSTDWLGLLDGNDDPTYIDPGDPGEVYVPPDDAPPPVILPEYRLAIELVDANGVLWDLARGPVRLTTAGLQGLGLPDVDWQTSEAAGVDGQRLTGWRLKSRKVFVPVRFKDASATDTTGLQRAFWDGLRIGSYVTFRVTDRDGGVRELTMRLADDGGVTYRIQPDLAMTEAIGLTFTADDPWWYGPAVETPYAFDNSAGSDFFGGAAHAPDFYIGAASGSSGVFKLDNPGDAPAWIVWSVSGRSVQAWSASVGGATIASSDPMDDGSLLVVDTDPRRQTARLDGVRYPFRLFDSIQFAQIPAGGEQPVTLSVTGAGSIVARFRPRYFRGF